MLMFKLLPLKEKEKDNSHIYATILLHLLITAIDAYLHNGKPSAKGSILSIVL